MTTATKNLGIAKEAEKKIDEVMEETVKDFIKSIERLSGLKSFVKDKLSIKCDGP